jgi:hypothetical protein
MLALGGCNTAQFTLIGIGNSSKHVAVHIESRADNGSTAGIDQTAKNVDWESLTDQAGDGQLPINVTMPLAEKAQEVVSTVLSKGTGVAPVKDKLVDIIKDNPVKEEPVAEDIPDPAKQTVVHSAWYNGRTNGNRPTWYFNANMSAYPKAFSLDVPGCKEGIAVTNNGTRWEGSGYLVKASDVSGRGMAVLAPATCNPDETISIRY